MNRRQQITFLFNSPFIILLQCGSGGNHAMIDVSMLCAYNEGYQYVKSPLNCNQFYDCRRQEYTFRKLYSCLADEIFAQPIELCVIKDDGAIEAYCKKTIDVRLTRDEDCLLVNGYNIKKDLKNMFIPCVMGKVLAHKSCSGDSVFDFEKQICKDESLQ
ncbi:uncharacterized protein LOC128248024 [Octopus bimaculoides]|uniref:uncharacterized protein LOC128248024 n=1 Tax=Octopus bimaculoides TaxID=37653 RepID=UPI0022E91ED9|nr:uncharacterized protein LOC128248024 [Octopus bimaculoides]